MLRQRRLVLALACSFAIYLLPLVGPHAVWLLGESLLQVRHQSVTWLLTNLSTALLLQASVFGILFWVFTKPDWGRLVVPVLALPVLFIAVQWTYLVAIPIHFLEEPDAAPEKLTWKQACQVPNYFLSGLQTGSELWVGNISDPSGYAVLTMPACQMKAVAIPKPVFVSPSRVDAMIDPVSVISGGRAVVRRTAVGDGAVSFYLAAGTLSGLLPPKEYGKLEIPPVLSADGKWAAWIERLPGEPPLQTHILIQELGGKKQVQEVTLSSLGAASYTLYRLEDDAQRILLWRNDGLIAVDRSGRVVHRFPEPARVRAQPQTYLSDSDHWLAWDAYQESRPYQVEWSLAGGSGSHRVLLGRTIHSAAMDSAGRWIAISVGTSLNIGNGRDSVYVLRASDGQEVFRKYLPRYCRSPVALLASGHLAYSDLEGVHLLELPRS